MADKVAIVVGSTNDLSFIEGTRELLDTFGISYEVLTLSAHRSLDRTTAFAETAEENGFAVIIACAGMAAHLPGVIAAKTILPVIGVPLPTSDIRGMDSLLAIVQMPSGVPVATMAIGKAGAKNAAILVAEIIGRSNPAVQERLRVYKENLG